MMNDDEILEAQVPPLYSLTVTTDVLNVREAPTLDSRVRGKLHAGDHIREWAQHRYGVWRYVDSGTLTGWVHGAYLKNLFEPVGGVT